MYRLKKWLINDILSCDIDIYTVYYSINHIIIIMSLLYLSHSFLHSIAPFFPKQVQLSWHLKPIGSLMNFPSVAPRAGMDTKPHGFNEATTRRLTEAMRFLQLRTYSLFLVGWMYIMGYSKKMYIYIYQIIIEITWNYNNLHWNKAVFKETLWTKLQG